MNPSLSSHPAFQDPRHRGALPGMNQVAEIQPIMPVNMLAISIPMFWPGDEWRKFTWDSVDYIAAPRSILKVGSKLQHQRDDKGNVMFGLPVEIAPNGDAATNATALSRKYGDQGLVILGADDQDEARKLDARQNKYNVWRYNEARKNRQRHRDECARAMRANVPSPVPPDSLAADEAFIRMIESGGGSTDLSRRFVCQPDGSRWPTRQAAWERVRAVDASKMSDPSAVFDTMHDIPEPGVVTSAAPNVVTQAPQAPVCFTPDATQPPAVDAISALRAEAKELKARAFDEDIAFPPDLKRSLLSDDIEVLQIAVEDARTLIDGPSMDTMADRAGL